MQQFIWTILYDSWSIIYAWIWNFVPLSFLILSRVKWKMKPIMMISVENHQICMFRADQFLKSNYALSMSHTVWLFLLYRSNGSFRNILSVLCWLCRPVMLKTPIFDFKTEHCFTVKPKLILYASLMIVCEAIECESELY